MKKKAIKVENSNYSQLLEEIKSILQRGLGKAYKAVDNIRVQTYWQVGERIVREELANKERAGYGEKIIDNLADDLSFRRDELYRMVQFYKTYPIVVTVSQQLSWSHYMELIKLKKEEERKFYEIKAIQERWSIRELRKRINYHEYGPIKKTSQLTVKYPAQLPAPEEVFKDIYHWNFLELEEGHNEKQLEDSLLQNVPKMLLEFGQGFAFMGVQQKILIASQWHKVDLVFYHRLLRCAILVELKTEKFKPEFVGQINKYLTYFRESKLHDERDPIGLIICKEKNEEEVHYALGKLKEDIFVAEYKTYLPSEEEIKRRLKLMGK